MADSARHIVLAGDSIFDNDSYVPSEPGVIEQMRRSLPNGWSAFKVAVDGDCIRDVPGQVANLPTHVTDLVVSVGGNDAIQYSHLINEVRSPQDIERVLGGPVSAFQAEYGAMLDHLLRLPVRLSVCTIYTAVPFAEPEWRLFAPAAIGKFNDAVLAEAARRNIPVLRLDRVCTVDSDFSAISPIEPSTQGGQKIVDHIMTFMGHVSA
jgi:hypothetical protein